MQLQTQELLLTASLPEHGYWGRPEPNTETKPIADILLMPVQMGSSLKLQIISLLVWLQSLSLLKIQK